MSDQTDLALRLVTDRIPDLPEYQHTEVAKDIVRDLAAAGWLPEDPAPPRGIWAEVQAERDRAHAKHGEKSMESSPWTSERRLRILVEEVGEVAKELNDADIEGRGVDPEELRSELIQVAAMAGAWADAVPAADEVRIERVNQYTLSVDGHEVIAGGDTEERIRSLDTEGRKRFLSIMGKGTR